MKIESISLKTDLIFARFAGEVIERESYLVIKTRSNPGYHWGNFLVFANPPVEGDEKRWPELFKQEFSDISDINHIAFTWDKPQPGSAINLFVENGFAFEPNIILSAQIIQKPEKFNTQVKIRPICTDQEWEAVILEQVTVNDKYNPEKFLAFKQAQMGNFRKMSEAGLGHCFGAFLGNDLVGDLGIYFEGAIGRFQSVVTLPSQRRKGICGRLVYEAARHALENFGVTTLVMVADENYHAAKIYESVGFLPSQSNFTLAKWSETLDRDV